MFTVDRLTIRPKVCTVPFGVDLSEATTALVLEHCGQDSLLISTATLLLPNNRAVKAMTEAFVRGAKPGLLLPRMVAIGDLALDEALGPMLDPLDEDVGIWPVIGPAARLMLLAQLVNKHRSADIFISPAETLRLARHLTEMIDELEIEQVDISALENMTIEAELQIHWQSSYKQLLAILPEYRRVMAERKLLGPSERRNLLLDRLGARLRNAPPEGLFVAAGITTAAKAVAHVLSAIARLPQGMVILPGVDLEIKNEQWDSLGPHDKTESETRARRSHEAHPQFHLKLLLERMGIRREEIDPIVISASGAMRRATTITDIFCLPNETANWGELPADRKKLTNVAMFEASDSAEEARAIAVKVRETLERPSMRISVVTPDRELAVRVAAQLRRWQIMVDDSAGTPLLQTPHGTLILALAEGFANRFSPVSLLAIVKHPLVHAGEGRLAWLEMARRLDFRLRGPATGKGLNAVTTLLASSKDPDPELAQYWDNLFGVLSEVERHDSKPLDMIITAIQNAASKLTDGGIWKGATGRQFAELWEEFAACDLEAIGQVERASVPAILSEMFGRAVVRPPYGGHPRVAIYGLLEARMQQADLVICGGLNEGTWPQIAQPDPWLAPAIRRHLGLATLDRNVGLSAHDLSIALGAKQVLLTRAKRDRSGPTVASRFLLRIKALLGQQLLVEPSTWSSIIDQPAERLAFAERPEPEPNAEQRRVDLSVTDFDQLKSDPYSFYAKRILRFRALEPVDSEPSYAWRGTLVHDVLEKWFIEDSCHPDKLIDRAKALLVKETLDPTMRALWQPRVAAGLSWIANETMRLQEEEGRALMVAERSGSTELLGIKIKGRADRIDMLADGSLAIIDYKTGGAPKSKQVTAGFAMQLGLVGLMAERGAIKGVAGRAAQFEYWSVAKGKTGFGHIVQPTSKKPGDKHIDASSFVAFIKMQAEEALAKYITGTAPFGAKLHPEYANYDDYDQLMRLQEWNGRQINIDGAGE